jgi:hypothetical protein
LIYIQKERSPKWLNLTISEVYEVGTVEYQKILKLGMIVRKVIGIESRIYKMLNGPVRQNRMTETRLAISQF